MRIKLLFFIFLTAILPTAAAYAENDASRFSAGISQEALAKKIELKREKKISFVLADLRLEAEYRNGHLPGAVNTPLNKLRFLAEQMFAKSEDIVFYGYSRNDRASTNAVVLLVNKGFEQVSLLDGGFEEWKGKVE